MSSARDVGRSKPERAELRNQIYVGSSVPPESPSMNPETGRLSATHASKVMKVAESQNGVNPYAIALIGGLIAVPLIALMVFLTIKFGVVAAILAAVLTDILASILTGTFKLRYGIEIAIIAIFIWLGVIVANKLALVIKKMFVRS